MKAIDYFVRQENRLKELERLSNKHIIEWTSEDCKVFAILLNHALVKLAKKLRQERSEDE